MEKETKFKDGKYTAGINASCWFDGSNHTSKFRPLQENMETDVVVVGGGIAGLSVAYCLVNKGKKVILIEDGFIGSGESGRTTAQFVTALDDRYYHLTDLFGLENIKLIAESHKEAINFVEDIVNKEHLDCDFERLNGYLFLHHSDENESLKKELEATLNAGLNVYGIEKVPDMLKDEGSCICFPDQAQLHPIKYLYGLARLIEKKGGRIFTQTHAKDVTPEGITTSDGYEIKANHIVIATNSPINNKYGIHLKQNGYLTYVIAALVKKGSIKRALWWDTGDMNVNSSIPPYHYVRLKNYNDEYDLLISGGEDHPVGDTNIGLVPEENRYKILERWTREHFPIEDIVYRWSGQVMEPMDSIAYIGRNVWDKDNVYIITGDSGNGMTHCTIAGLLISDLIAVEKSKWEHIYKPSRFNMKASLPYFKDFMAGFLSYLKNKPTHLDSVKLSSIKKGEGKIVELENKKCGAYRDHEGMLHIVSAECTHLKCIIKWNNDEKSWDCPCHGSRFTFDGKVIHGPANSDLPAYSEIPEEHAEERHA